MPVTRQRDESEDEDYRDGDELFVSTKNRQSGRNALNGTTNDGQRTARLSAIKANNAIGTMAARRQQPMHDNPSMHMEIENGIYAASEGEDIDEDDDDDDDDDAIDGFRMKAKLPEPKMAKRNIAQLMILLDGEFLDVNPAYQRDVVWPMNRMSKLVDSLMENFYVPPVLFNVEEIKSEDGKPRFKRTCVDGKQRLTSIRDFMHGKIPCHNRHGHAWFYCVETDEEGNPVKRTKRSILPETVKEEFKKKDLLCCEYKDLTEIQEREIFQRVQLGMALTDAEAFRATKGVWQKFAQLYEEDFPNVINLCKNKRASGFRRILICFSQIYECQDPTAPDGVPRLKHTMPAMRQFCKNEDSLNAKTKQHLRHVFEEFNDLIQDDPSVFEDHNYRNVKTFSPIELVAVCVLISQHSDKRPRGLLKGDILAIRDQLRSVHVDLRMNERCWSTAWDYIDNIEQYRGAVGGSTNPKRPAKGGRRSVAVAIQTPVLDRRTSAVTPRKTIPKASPQPEPEKVFEDTSNQDISIHEAGSTGPEHVIAQGRESDLILPDRPANSKEAGRESLDGEDNSIGRHNNSEVLSRNSAVEGHTIPTAVMTTQPRRKRVNLDLGMNLGEADALAAKKARLMGNKSKK